MAIRTILDSLWPLLLIASSSCFLSSDGMRALVLALLIFDVRNLLNLFNTDKFNLFNKIAQTLSSCGATYRVLFVQQVLQISDAGLDSKREN